MTQLLEEMHGLLARIAEGNYCCCTDELIEDVNMALTRYEQSKTGLSNEGWLPISEAPKDGTLVDLWQDGKRYTDVFWSFSRNAKTKEPLSDPVWDGWAREGSVGMSHTPNYIEHKGQRATHYRPLPAPPKQENE